VNPVPLVNSPEIAHLPVVNPAPLDNSPEIAHLPGGPGADTANGTGTPGNASNSQGGSGTGTPNNPSSSQGGFGTGALNSASNSMHLPRLELPASTFKMPGGLGQTGGAIQFAPKPPAGQVRPSDLPNGKH
jgi:hypothetical protein